MYFPTEVFRYINEFNGVDDYFPKKIINLLRYSSCDDLEHILKLVLDITYIIIGSITIWLMLEIIAKDK